MTTNQQAFQEIILDSIADGVFTVDMQRTITSFNKSAERITGTPKKEAIGRQCWEVFRANICQNNCALEHTLQTGKPCINKTVHIVNNNGKKIPISISTALLKTTRGKVVGGVETFRDLSPLEELRKELLGKHTFADIITKDNAMLRIFDVLPSMAKSNSTMLIIGESGTGKELLARAIHNLSDRASGPFVSVNCSALPDTLLESELFGYKKGAFTDAKKDKPGRFTLAKGGTLFLDEIGDISKAMQAKLLRVLQEKTFEPLGAVSSEKADVRIITATNQDLDLLVKNNDFRKDLFYRINVLTVQLPPLRHRRQDIPLLVEHFITHFNGLYRKEITHISDEALQILMRHEFSGNIRELQNIIEHAIIMCPSIVIEKAHLPEYLIKESVSPATAAGVTPQNMEEFERMRIEDALAVCRYNKKEAAQKLGIHVTTLWRKMKRLGIE